MAGQWYTPRIATIIMLNSNELIGHGLKYVEIETTRRVEAHLPATVSALVAGYSCIPTYTWDTLSDPDFDLTVQVIVDGETWEINPRAMDGCTITYINCHGGLNTMIEYSHVRQLLDNIINQTLHGDIFDKINSMYSRSSEVTPLAAVTHLVNVAQRLVDGLWAELVASGGR